MPPRSLIHAVQDRYLSSIRSVETASRWKILVTDSFSHTLLFSVLKTDQILQENVTSIENIEHKRAPQPSFEAAYILCPTSKNVEAIINDLAPDNAEPKYAAGHIFFIDALSEPLLRRLTNSPAERKLKKLIELFVNIWPLESQVFSLKTPQTFHTIFQPLSGLQRPGAPKKALEAIEDELQFSTAAILNVCVTLNEFPLIRYYNPSHPPLGPLAPPPNAAGNGSSSSSATQIAANAASSLYASSARMARLRGGANEIPPASVGAGAGAGSSQSEHFSRQLAHRVQKAIDDYIRDNEPKIDTVRPRGVLFITDRSMDPVAPFLHEFTYQAMCNDLLPIEDNGTRYKYSFYDADGQLDEHDAVLGEEDSIWTGVRHLHIAEAIAKLTKDFKKHADEAGVFSGGAQTSLNDMKDMLVALPHMQEMKAKLSLHISMAQACMSRFEQTKLPQQAMVEQNCATRLTPEGQKPKTLVEEMVPLIDDRNVSNMDKVRIIALYIMYCDGVPDEDRKRLFQHARLGLHEMDAVDNLVHLGACIVKDPQTNALVGGWDAWFRKGKRKQQPTGEEYDVSRYQPLVKLMVEDHFAGRLDVSQYPYVRDGPPGSSADAVGGSSSSSSSLLSVGMNTGLSVGSSTSLSLASFRGSSPAPPISPSPSPGPGGRPQPNSLRSAKPAWATKGRPPAGGIGGSSASGSDRNGLGRGGAGGGGVGGDSRDSKRQRVLVFVAGGMTYSEIRSAYELTDKLGMDMYIGSSHTFTPEDFVDSLRKFGKSGAGGHAVPGSGAIGAPPPSQGYDPRNGHPPPHQQYQGHSHGHGAPPHQAGYAGYNGGGNGGGGGGQYGSGGYGGGAGSGSGRPTSPSPSSIDQGKGDKKKSRNPFSRKK
ncbi:unnamed protein product [Tilletia caries]|nr:unnamed protein product [Tilletia caries]